MRRIAPLCVPLGVAVAVLFAGLLAFSGARAQAETAEEAPLSAEQSPPPAEGLQWPAEPAPPPPEESVMPPPASEEFSPAGAEPPPSEPAPPPPAEPPPPQPEVEMPPPLEETQAVEAPALPEDPAEGPEQEEKAGRAPLTGPGQETVVSSQSSPIEPSTAAASTSEGDAAPQDTTYLWPDAASLAEPSPGRSTGHVASAGCGLAAPITTGCAVGWLGLTAQPSISSTALIASSSFPAQISEGESEGAAHRRGPVSNPPSSPTPAPEPGGSGGVSAAGCGSGSACAAFTSIGLGLSHAQISTRAVILDQPSWRTSFFVLVPERPG